MLRKHLYKWSSYSSLFSIVGSVLCAVAFECGGREAWEIRAIDRIRACDMKFSYENVENSKIFFIMLMMIITNRISISSLITIFLINMIKKMNLNFLLSLSLSLCFSSHTNSFWFSQKQPIVHRNNNQILFEKKMRLSKQRI